MPCIKRIPACLALLAVISCAVCACKNSQSGELSFSGHTMGTTYTVLFVPQNGLLPEKIKAATTEALNAVNQSMSVFEPQSEISRFNALSAADTQNNPFEASAAFYAVMLQAKDIYDKTGGAWDGTVKPLVDLWGFGALKVDSWPPTDEAVKAALQNTGFNKIIPGPNQTLVKTANVTLDLSSIAKGYGVDYVAEALNRLGLENFLVEIGGEVYTKGVKANGAHWRVGINRPVAEALSNSVYKVTALSNMAMATSGGYRNFLKLNSDNVNETFIHIIDPHTGYPLKTPVVSVTVIAPGCALADGWATAMYVLGREQSLKLAETEPDMEIFIIEQLPNGDFVDYMSSGMARYLQ